MSNQYIINFPNQDKAALEIPPGELNYDTSLVLFGMNTPDWDVYYNTNVLRLLEHFSNDYPPGYTDNLQVGQLWFDSFNKQLKICTSVDPINWLSLCNNKETTLENIVTYDILKNYITEYIRISGCEMTGPLLVPVPTNDNDLANIKYVDHIACTCSDVQATFANYLTYDGGNFDIVIHDNYTGTVISDLDAYRAATIDYIKSKLQLSYSYTNINVVSSTTQCEFIYSQFNSANSKHYCIAGKFTIPKNVSESTLTINPPNGVVFSTYHLMYTSHTHQPNSTLSNEFSDVYCSESSISQHKFIRTKNDTSCEVNFNIFGVISGNNVVSSTPLTSTTNRKPKNFLLAVGVSDYQGKILDLDGPVNDVDLITEMFKSLNCDTTKLINELATKDAVVKKLTSIIKNAISGDKIFFYFSGHGGNDTPNAPDKGEYLAMYDCINKDDKEYDYTKMLYDTEFLNIINSSTVHIECIIDSCFSGGITTPNKPNFVTGIKGAKNDNVIIWASSSEIQESATIPIGSLMYSAFTYALVKNGIVTLPSTKTRDVILTDTKTWIDQLWVEKEYSNVKPIPELSCSKTYLQSVIS